MTLTASSVLFTTSCTIVPIFSTAIFVCSESFWISSATTANSFPCSPALAASIVAFNANIFVWLEICVIVSIIPIISLDYSPRLLIISLQSFVLRCMFSILTVTSPILLWFSRVFSPIWSVKRAVLWFILLKPMSCSVISCILQSALSTAAVFYVSPCNKYSVSFTILWFACSDVSVLKQSAYTGFPLQFHIFIIQFFIYLLQHLIHLLPQIL